VEKMRRRERNWKKLSKRERVKEEKKKK